MQAGKPVQRSGTNGRRLGRADRVPFGDRRMVAAAASLRCSFTRYPYGSLSSSGTGVESATWSAARRALAGTAGLVGDHRAEVTPVPIPNTEVKLRSPMILLRGKVGYRRLIGPRRGNSARPFVFLRPSGAAGVGAGRTGASDPAKRPRPVERSPPLERPGPVGLARGTPRS